MPLQRSQLPPARDVPELDGASEVPRSDRPIIRRKSDGIHWACKSLQRPQLPPACCVPELDQKATECTLSVCPCSVSKLINDVSPNFLPLPSRAGPIPAATRPSLRGALATKQSRGHNMRGASNPDDRTAAPGLLRFARNNGQGIGSLVSACRLG
jgi:hypothetical protein